MRLLGRKRLSARAKPGDTTFWLPIYCLPFEGMDEFQLFWCDPAG